MGDNSRAVADTVRHAVMLAEKGHKLLAQASEAMAVAAELTGAQAQHVDPAVLPELVRLARAAAVPGRGKFTTIADRVPRHLEVGNSGAKSRGDGGRWPGRGLQVVYVLLDADATLLYIGKTGHMAARMRAHAEKPWVTVHWHVCRDRAEASELEADLIYHHQPPMNQAGRSTRLRRTA